ncbi:aminotransferase class III-fold pyridoxal phosphate-dependent enzyme [Streptomyces sp. NPDC051572]|uniref:aminotransferase class III-fold pyridoxal phosphate-dependent enzyme n=1 Tax=Streptomyces sp. NPDC051572 TaxID=3155802 RepID=UPI00344B4106
MSSRLLLDPVSRLAAEALTGVAPAGLDRVHFAGPGTESVEAAVKLARAHSRPRLISMRDGWHGKTLGTLSLTAKALYQDPFRPLLPDIQHVPFGDGGADACVVVEPVRSEAGVVVPRPGYPAGAARFLVGLRRRGRTAGRARDGQGAVQRCNAGLLDAMEEIPAGQVVNLRAEFTHPLPMRMIYDLFGVPARMRAAVARLIEGIMDTTGTPKHAADALEQIVTVLPALIAEKSENLGDDLTTELITIRDRGDRLSEEELIHTLLLVIGAGFETTVNLIGNAVHALLRHPDQLKQVLAGQSTWNEVIQETLRRAPSIANVPLRYAVSDITTADGTTIRAGEAILTTIAASGHDPVRFGPDAHLFDVARNADGHRALGIGVHRRVGAPPARMEALTALPTLFARFPGISLAVAEDEWEQVPSFIAQGRRELPVRLAPATPSA